MEPRFFADDQRTVAYFAERAAHHGNSVLAVDWGSEASQGRRFEVLASVGIDARASVLDVGCGLGAFRSWLKGKGFEGEYVGVDLSKDLLELARKGQPDGDFRELSALDIAKLGRTFDVVVASGIFYLRQEDPYAFVEAAVAAMWERSSCAVAFNSLSAWSPEKDEGEFYAEPLRVLDIAHRHTSRVVLRHEYHPRDFAVLLHR